MIAGPTNEGPGFVAPAAGIDRQGTGALRWHLTPVMSAYVRGRERMVLRGGACR